MSKMDFRKVDVEEIKAITPKAILIDWPKHEDGQLWIPRSVLSTATDKAVEAYLGEPMTIEVHGWFANREGLDNG